MVKLAALTPCAGLLPREVGDVALVEATPETAHLVAPLRDGERATATTVHGAFGLAWPAANRLVERDGVRLTWFGPGRALLTGAPPPVFRRAVVTDLSDAHAVVAVEGASVRAVLARLIPIDLHDEAFVAGATARTRIGHMTGSVSRTGPDRFELMVYRSMARTLVDDLVAVADRVAARGRGT